METTTYSYPITSSYTQQVAKQSVWARFIGWCEGQQHNRLLWIGIALAVHGCVTTPITIMTVLVAGNNLAFFMAATAAMGMALVTNLAAMPTKITIPVFLLSVLIDLGIIAACVVNGFNV